MCPPEFSKNLDYVGYYYICFYIDTNNAGGGGVDKLSGEIQESLCIYGLKHNFRVRRREAPEILKYLNTINSEPSDEDSMLRSDNWAI